MGGTALAVVEAEGNQPFAEFVLNLHTTPAPELEIEQQPYLLQTQGKGVVGSGAFTFRSPRAIGAQRAERLQIASQKARIAVGHLGRQVIAGTIETNARAGHHLLLGIAHHRVVLAEIERQPATVFSQDIRSKFHKSYGSCAPVSRKTRRTNSYPIISSFNAQRYRLKSTFCKF